ncbi:hypothetical protein [Cuneatibacter caecimuris]|uniref:hypothetical protein n=1 Tax=Cuneatibacter caecimuris TaxID=1796618 RepID=UPI0013EE44EA|nr:hypothetical protein [Cuneatibacter caecimuris]
MENDVKGEKKFISSFLYPLHPTAQKAMIPWSANLCPQYNHILVNHKQVNAEYAIGNLDKVSYN